MSSYGSVVKLGTFLYAGAVECDVRIVFSPVRFGSGDFEDPVEVREDIAAPTFYVEYGSTTERGIFNTGGGGYPSLAAAEAAAQTALGSGASVRWCDEA